MTVEIRLLGRFLVRSGGVEVPPRAFSGRLARTLVRLLATQRGRLVPHDVLAEALWPAGQPADPVANLQALVNRARRALGDPGLVLTGQGGYALVDGAACTVDGEQFAALIETGRTRLAAGETGAALRAFKDALAIWAEPLPEDAYADWAQSYRAALTRSHLEVLEYGAAAALALRDPAAAVALAERAVEREPLREGAAVLLARSLAAAGDTAAALACLHELRRRLRTELGLDPGPDVADLQRRLLAGEVESPANPAVPVQAPPPTFGELAFVGREGELAALGEALGEVPAVALLTGGPGSGKTRMLEEIARRVPVALVVGRAFLAERDEPWSLARSVLREALAFDVDVVHTLPPRAAPALTEILPELDDLLAGAFQTPLDAESRRALAMEAGIRVLTTLLAHGARLVVDDLQWADATSLRMLAVALARAPRPAAVLAYRPADAAARPEVAGFLDDLTAGCAVVEVDVGPLPPEAISRLVADEELAGVLATRTDATPMAVSELLRALVARRLIEHDSDGRWRPRDPTAAAEAVDLARVGQRRSIAARVGRARGRSGDLLELLALLARETPAQTLAVAVGQQQAEVLDTLDALARVGLVRIGESGWAVAHDLVGEIVAEGLAPGRRTARHAALAAALTEAGEDAAEIARHLAGGGDAVGAAQQYLRAATQRLEHHSAAETVALAGAGLGLRPEPGLRGRLHLVRAEGLAIVGDRHRAREDLRAALPAQAGGRDRSLVLTRMALLTMAEDLARAGDLVEMALTDAAGDRAARAEALTIGAFVDTTAGRLERSDARAGEALRLFEQLGDGRGVARILDSQAGQLMFGGRLPEGEQLMGRAAQLYLDAGVLALVGTPLCQRGWALIWMDRAAEALADAETALELERTLGQAEGEGLALVVRGAALAAGGSPAEGQASVGAGREILERLGVRQWVPGALYFLADIAEEQAQPALAEALLREAVEVAGPSPFPASVSAALLGGLRLRLGDLDEAGSWARRAIAAGIPVARLEADLVLADIGLGRDEPGAAGRAVAAVARAETGGWLASRTLRRLRERIAGQQCHPAR